MEKCIIFLQSCGKTNDVGLNRLYISYEHVIRSHRYSRGAQFAPARLRMV
jgi:hypothetical protein